MKKITFLFLVFVGLLFSSCQQEMISDVNSENDLFKADKNQKKLEIPVNFNILFNSSDSQGCTDPVIMPLTAGQNIDVGTLELSSDDTYLYVTYNVNKTYAGEASEWYLAETHLFVGCDASEIPMNGGGNPVIGHFPYSENHAPEKSVTYTIYLTDFDCDAECLIISAHSTVITLDSNSQQDQDETAFGGCNNDSSEFAGSRWGCYFEYCLEDCEEKVVGYMIKYRNLQPVLDRVTCFEDNSQGETIYGFSNRLDYYTGLPSYGGTFQALTPPGQSWPVMATVSEDCDLSEVQEIGTVTLLLGDLQDDAGIKLTFKGSNGYENANGVWSGLVSWTVPVSLDGKLIPGLESEWFELFVVNGEAVIEIDEADWPGVPKSNGTYNQYYLISGFVLDK